MFCKQPIKADLVADVQIDRAERVTELSRQPLTARLGGRLNTEEVGPHVIVEANDVESFTGEEARRLRPNQATGPTYYGYRHDNC